MSVSFFDDRSITKTIERLCYYLLSILNICSRCFLCELCREVLDLTMGPGFPASPGFPDSPLKPIGP